MKNIKKGKKEKEFSLLNYYFLLFFILSLVYLLINNFGNIISWFDNSLIKISVWIIMIGYSGFWIYFLINILHKGIKQSKKEKILEKIVLKNDKEIIKQREEIYQKGEENNSSETIEMKLLHQ